MASYRKQGSIAMARIALIIFNVEEKTDNNSADKGKTGFFYKNNAAIIQNCKKN